MPRSTHAVLSDASLAGEKARMPRGGAGMPRGSTGVSGTGVSGGSAGVPHGRAGMSCRSAGMSIPARCVCECRGHDFVPVFSNAHFPDPLWTTVEFGG